MMRKKFIILLSTSLLVLSSYAQCEREKIYFEIGEKLNYSMYFKLGLINTEAGELSLKASEGNFQGRGDIKLEFISNTNGLANKIFSVHDTLTSFVTNSMVPIAYWKKAHEGGTFTDEELIYNYSDHELVITSKRYKNHEFKFKEELTTNKCVYDLVSVIYYSRTLDFDSMKPGDLKELDFISGKTIGLAYLEMQGDKNVKDSNGKKHPCKELILYFSSEDGQKPDKDRESMKIFITDDNRRIPIQIETKLKKVGAVKGILSTKL